MLLLYQITFSSWSYTNHTVLCFSIYGHSNFSVLFCPLSAYFKSHLSQEALLIPITLPTCKCPSTVFPEQPMLSLVKMVITLCYNHLFTSFHKTVSLQKEGLADPRVPHVRNTEAESNLTGSDSGRYRRCLLTSFEKLVAISGSALFIASFSLKILVFHYFNI